MDAVKEANDKYDPKAELNIQGFDKDYIVLKTARENAVNAGVDHFIHFQERDVAELTHKRPYGVIVTNPPYGERLSNPEEVEKLYKLMGKTFPLLENWSHYILTSYEKFEHAYGQKADKKRKLYNGMLKTTFYQYLGKRPPRKRVD